MTVQSFPPLKLRAHFSSLQVWRSREVSSEPSILAIASSAFAAHSPKLLHNLLAQLDGILDLDCQIAKLILQARVLK